MMEESSFSPQLEKLINMALVDGEITDKERQVLIRRAEAEGVDPDEFEMELEARLYMRQQQNPTPDAPKPTATEEQPARKSNKCPACGAMVPAFTTKCPECGVDLHNTAAAHSVSRLFEMLNEVDAKFAQTKSTSILDELFTLESPAEKATRQKKTIVQNFPVPTTKEDILEFLALAAPLAKKKGFFGRLSADYDPETDMTDVWRAKCEQIIIKAKFSMKNDPQTLAEILEYGKKIGIN